MTKEIQKAATTSKTAATGMKGSFSDISGSISRVISETEKLNEATQTYQKITKGLDANGNSVTVTQTLGKDGVETIAKSTTKLGEYQKMLNTWQTLGYATDAVAKYFGVPKGTQTSDYKFSAAQLAMQQAEFGLSQQKFAYQKAKDAADNQNEDGKRNEKINEVKSTKISDLINNSGGTKEQKSQMKILKEVEGVEQVILTEK